MTDAIVSFLLSQSNGVLLYLFIMFFMFLESVILIIPSEVVMAVTGYLAYQGKIHLWMSVSISALGTVLGSLILYLISAHFGVTTVLRLLGRFVTEGQINRARKMFHRYDKVSVLFAQFVPGVRTLISVPAGLFGMNILQFFVFTYIGSFVWNTVWIGTSYRLGGYTDKVLRIFSVYKEASLLVLGAVIVVICGIWFLKRSRLRLNNY